jgi:hypothetical protein
MLVVPAVADAQPVETKGAIEHNHAVVTASIRLRRSPGGVRVWRRPANVSLF